MSGTTSLSLASLSRSAVSFAALSLLTACGGGGGGLPPPSAAITETTVKSELAKIEDTTTQCAVGPSGRALGTALKLADVVDTARAAGTMTPVPRASFTLNIAGDCTTPGHFIYTNDHNSGVTDTTIDFRDYCVTGTAGDTVYNGVVKAKEIGSPTASGPLVTAHEIATVGAVTIQPGDPTATLEVTLTPDDIWSPGRPCCRQPGHADHAVA